MSTNLLRIFWYSGRVTVLYSYYGSLAQNSANYPSWTIYFQNYLKSQIFISVWAFKRYGRRGKCPFNEHVLSIKWSVEQLFFYLICILLAGFHKIEFAICICFSYWCNLKGQCQEIFCFWIFSWISFPLAPECSTRTVSNFFRKFLEIFASQGAPLVSTTPAANFSTSCASVVDTGGKLATDVKLLTT